MSDFAYRTDRPVVELRKELEDLAAGWTLAPGTEFATVDAGGVDCEWITAPSTVGTLADGTYTHNPRGDWFCVEL